MRNCGYCGRDFSPRNRDQKYCCPSCKNCAKSSARMTEKDTERLRKMVSYYAGTGGRGEVERGLHDDKLKSFGITREQWLANWDERWDNGMLS